MTDSNSSKIDANRAELVAQINALPPLLRQYVHDLETDADPAGDKMRLVLLEQQVAGLGDEVVQLRGALEMIYDKWEDGTSCYEDPEDYTGYLGHAVNLTEAEEQRILDLLPTGCTRHSSETISRPTPFSDQQSDAGLVNQELQDAMLNPATQVMFRAGLLAAREYMAAFVEVESPSIAASIRANWWPSLGADPGRPRRLRWDDVYQGEYPEGRPKTKEEVSPSTEALVQAAVFLMKHCGWPQSHCCFGEGLEVEKTSTPPAEREGRLRCTACGGVGLHEPGCRSGTCDCRCHTSSGPETRSICPHCHHPMGDFK